MRVWIPIKNGEIDKDNLYWPSKMRKPQDILIHFDLFDSPHELIDVVLAVICSAGHTRFFYEDANVKKRSAYMKSLKKRGIVAAKNYERKMRAHFKKYKMQFIEGYSLPDPPTPEIRAIYNTAAEFESRPINPCGTTIHKGFSLGEYHWRGWPLGNLIDMDTDWDKSKKS